MFVADARFLLKVDLPLPGLHNLRNACAAAAIAVALDVPPHQIRTGLESVAPVEGRLRLPVLGALEFKVRAMCGRRAVLEPLLLLQA